jgi:predicted GNAT family acetyltransferase
MTETTSAAAEEALSITDNAERQRFEARLDGELAGVLTYRRGADLVIYPHTKVVEAYEGRGIGGRLAKAALDDARERGLKVDPACPFIAAWIVRNPEYAELVAG